MKIMPKASSITFDDSYYNTGLGIYNSLIKNLDNLITNFNDAVANANECEKQNAPILYDGIYYSTICNIKNSLDTLKNKLEDSYKIINREREIAEAYNNGQLITEVATFALKRLKNAYFKKYSDNLKLGSTPENNINYINIYNEGYKPQGMTVIGRQVLITAYASEKLSKLYIYDLDDENKNYSIILDNQAHVGGITYDEKNHVLLITAGNGDINAYSLDAINNKANNIAKDGIIDINSSDGKGIKLNSTININYKNLSNGNVATDYKSSTVYFDNKDSKLYIARFSDNGKLISGDAVYDSSTGTYGITNATTADIDSCVQGISIYHKDDKTYFVESRSYGSNTSQITVRDITNGTENSSVVGNHALSHQYSEAIHIDDNGQTYILYEGNNKVKYDVTDTININDVISKGNTKVTPMSTGTDKYNGGDETPGGYVPKV